MEETRTPGEYLKDMVWDPIIYLKKQHTRELLLLKDACCKFNGFFSLSGDSGGAGVSYEQVKAELDTREHIPNKNEAKTLRRLMSQNRLSAVQVRAIPKYAALLAESAKK